MIEERSPYKNWETLNQENANIRKKEIQTQHSEKSKLPYERNAYPILPQLSLEQRISEQLKINSK